MSGLFGGGAGVSQSAPAIAGLRIQTSVYGKPIALLYGKTRLTLNLLDYADFVAESHNQGGGGGKGSLSSRNLIGMITVTGYGLGGSGSGEGGAVSYTYSAAVIMSLCEGEIAGIDRVWADKDVTTLAALNLSLYVGDTTQVAFPYWVTNHPDRALGYRRQAYVATGNYALGSSASLPNHSFEIEGLLQYGSGIVDANPPDVATDLLTHPTHGAGFPSALLGPLANFSDYCLASGIFMSPAYTQQTAAADMLKQIALIGNTGLVFSDKLLKFIPYGDTTLVGNGATYTPNLIADYNLTDDDFITDGTEDPVKVQRGRAADAFNQVQVQFYNRANNYNQELATANDQANIELYGLRPMPMVTLNEVCTLDIAQTIAQLILQRAIGIRNTYTFQLGWKYCRIEPMGLLTLTESTGTGLQAQPVRVTVVEEDDEGLLSITAEDFPAGLASSYAVLAQLAAGAFPNFNAPPGSANPPLIFDAPGRLARSGFEVWVAVGVDISKPLWGGCVVWLSTDGTTYTQANIMYGPSRYGVLTSTFDAGVDPDITNVCSVSLATSQGELISGDQADADLFNTLCWVDAELISYETATFTGTNTYDVDVYLRRGVYGTPIGSHPVAAISLDGLTLTGHGFARLDASIAHVPYDPSLIGQAVFIKLQSFNIFGGGIEDISSVQAWQFTIGGPIGSPADVTGFTATPDESGIMLSWAVVPDPLLVEYEVRVGGSDWASATYVGNTRTTTLHVAPAVLGLTTWRIKAISTGGNYSFNATAVILNVVGAPQTTITPQVIDNNVLLYWTAVAGTQPTFTYEIRKGATYAGAIVVGLKSGLFTSLSETLAGTYTYWVTAIDIAGNYGTPKSVSAVVAQPPDYVLLVDFNSILNGTLTNAILDSFGVLLPVDTTQTWTTHFTGPAWTNPQDQIDAGYPIYIQPAAGTGSYEEVLDYGTTIPSSNVSVAWDTSVVAGAPGITKTISVSNVSGTGPWTDYVGVDSIHATTFQWVKVLIDVTSGGVDLLRINGINIRLDVKTISDSGNVAALAADGPGTTVTFNVAFLDVTSITLTPLGTTQLTAVYDFVDVPNPTDFKVLVFDFAGNRVNATVSWIARGN